MLLAVLGLVVIGLVAYLGYAKMTATSDDAAPVPAEPRTPSSPIVVPIEDAGEVVTEINDNAPEEELLDELGLDPIGRPAPAGYGFFIADASGRSRSVQVDSTTGNYSIETVEGVAIRSIDGMTYTRTTAGDEWVPVDPAVLAAQSFGLDGITVVSDVLPSELAAYVSPVSTEVVGGIESSISSVDLAAFRTTDPALFATWSAPFGFDPATLGTFGTDPMTVTISVDEQGIVQSFVIAAPGDGPSMTYRLEALYDAAPLITL
jgi:hypothetical protein